MTNKFLPAINVELTANELTVAYSMLTSCLVELNKVEEEIFDSVEFKTIQSVCAKLVKVGIATGVMDSNVTREG